MTVDERNGKGAKVKGNNEQKATVKLCKMFHIRVLWVYLKMRAIFELSDVSKLKVELGHEERERTTVLQTSI